MLSLWNNLTPTINDKKEEKSIVRPYFHKIFDEFERSFDTMISDIFKDVNIGMDMQVSEDGVLSSYIDVPGIKREDLNIEIKNSIINVSGTRKTATSSYSINKSFSIPEGYDANSVVAELSDGVLKLDLKKKELKPPEEVKKIPISIKQSDI